MQRAHPMMKWFSLAFLLLLAAIIVAADKNRLPGLLQAMYSFPGGDKVGHFFLLGILTFLMNMSLPLRPANRPWRSLIIGSAVIAAAISIEEASQMFFPSRTLSWADLFSSYAGIVCFGCAAWIVRSRKREARQAC